jgi:hypothetical protein
LFVAARTSSRFEVRELNGGKSNVRFSYRIVARRKDIQGKRLEEVRRPDVPQPGKVARRSAPAKDGTHRLLRNLELRKMRETAARRPRK